MSIKTITTPDAPKAVGPYSQAAAAGGLLFVSGQIGLDPVEGGLKMGGIEEEASQALDNLEAILIAAGLNLKSVVKTTVLLTEMGDFASVNRVYGERFGSNPPARAAFAVKELPLGALIEIEAVAVLK